MKKYNAAFFGLFENVFKHLKKELGEEKALNMFRTIMVDGLAKAYGDDFVKGDPKEFVRLVGDRDNNVGLRVEFPVVEEDKIVYQFYDDPFPGLKDHVDYNKLVDTYMAFKVGALLGDNWEYETTKHIWQGDPCTEIVIVRSN